MFVRTFSILSVFLIPIFSQADQRDTQRLDVHGFPLLEEATTRLGDLRFAQPGL